jgi:hypothetical protein
MNTMKKIFFAFAFLVTGYASAQVGVGNTDPKATLDVNKASYATGEQAGIAVTQLTGAQVVAMTTSGLKAGTLVYATATSGVIDSVGFWYYSGSAWSKVGGASAPAVSVVTSTGATYSVTGTEDYILHNGPASTFTLPVSATVGKRIVIANNVASGGPISIAVASGGVFFNGSGYGTSPNNTNIFTYTASGWICEAIGLN